MRRPRLRSEECPFGFDHWEEKTQIGNLLGQRGSQMMRVAAVNGAAGILETLYSSYLKHLPGWKAFKKLQCAEEVRSDSCAFGSIHLKPLSFLGVNAPMHKLSRRCACNKPHVRVEGQYAKSSATYVAGLVNALAECFTEAIRDICQMRNEQLALDGLENQLVDEVALTAPWSVPPTWRFKKQSHINILEEASILRLANFLSREKCPPLRVVALVDSFVVRDHLEGFRQSCGVFVPHALQQHCISHSPMCQPG